MQIEGRRLEAAIRGAQARTLLSYLVLHRRRPVRREELVEVLWPDALPASPESALSTIVSRLRKVVGHETLCGRSELRLQLPADALVDVELAFEEMERAEQALELAAWEHATSAAEAALRVAVRGFLPEVDAGWAEEERRRLNEVRLRALECLAACGLALGGSRLSVTERAARRLIEASPYRETGHRYLMQAHVDRGRIADALRVFEDLRVLLQEQLGVAPSAGLRTLHERLLSEPGLGTAHTDDDPLAVGRPTSTARVDSAAGAQQPVALPPTLARGEREQFVGRDDELARLWALYEQAAAGTCRFAFVRGEPGIGKTRLAVELAYRAHRDAAMALYGRCDEEPLVAHQPFVEALSHYVAVCPRAQLAAQVGTGGRELWRLVPELAQRLPALRRPAAEDREGERYRLFQAVEALLRRVGEASPVVLVLDDLHWVDKSTLLLLRHLARQRPAGLLVLGMYRDAEIEPNQPLRDTVADLSREPGCERLPLGALDVAAVQELVNAHTGEQAPELVRKLWEETEGNPFFLGELLRLLAESGQLPGEPQRGASGGRLTELGVPEGVKDVIGRRIRRLGQPTQSVLATASVSGRTFEFAVLEHLSARDQDELLEALEEAVRAKLIEEVVGAAGQYTFTHALIRETIYGGLMHTRRALLHRRTAAALEESHGSDVQARSAELAHHLANAGAPGEIAKAVEYAARAGGAALGGLAYEQAAAHYRQAVRLLDRSPEPPPPPARRCDLVIAQGEAERQAGEATYRQTLLEGARLAQELADADRLARAALANNRGFFSAAAGVDDERVAVLRAALHAGGVEDTATRASLLAQLAVELVPDPDWKRRAQLSDEALAMARRVGDPMTLARTLNHRYVALWGPRSLAERVANAREANEVAARLGDPVLSFHSARFGCHAAMEAGDLALADALLERARDLVEQVGQPIIQWYYAVTRAKRESISGSPAEAERLVSDAFDLGQRVGQPDAALWRAIGLFVTRLLQGTLGEDAATAPETVRDAASATGARAAASRAVALLTTALQAATAAEAGRTGHARARFDVLMRNELADLPYDWTALAVPAVAAIACNRLRDVRRAQTLFAMLEPYAQQFADAGPSWFGAVSHHLAGLATTLGDFEAADALFADAAGVYAALSADAWLTRARLDWVGMLVARRSPRDLERARALLADVLTAAPRLQLPAVEHTAVSLLGTPGLAG